MAAASAAAQHIINQAKISSNNMAKHQKQQRKTYGGASNGINNRK